MTTGQKVTVPGERDLHLAKRTAMVRHTGIVTSFRWVSRAEIKRRKDEEHGRDRY